MEIVEMLPGLCHQCLADRTAEVARSLECLPYGLAHKGQQNEGERLRMNIHTQDLSASSLTMSTREQNVQKNRDLAADSR